jgi:hypothetical protein
MILLFACGGVSLKIADYYGERASKRIAYVSATVSAFIFGLLLSHNSISSAIILGIILGVLFSGKINQLNLFFGLALSLTIAFMFTFQFPLLWLLSLVTFFSFIDELSHDRYSSKNFFLANFFLLRPFLKMSFLLIASLSLIEGSYLLGFFCFDLSYDLTTFLLNKYVSNRKTPK